MPFSCDVQGVTLDGGRHVEDYAAKPRVFTDMPSWDFIPIIRYKYQDAFLLRVCALNCLHVWIVLGCWSCDHGHGWLSSGAAIQQLGRRLRCITIPIDVATFLVLSLA